MRRTVWHAVVVSSLLLVSWSAMAAPPGMISGGLVTSPAGLDPYVYAEVQALPDIAVGLEWNPAAISLSVWSGFSRGIYAEASWANIGFVRPDAAELGVWSDLSDLNVSIGYPLTVWGGIRAVSGDTRLQLSLNAELEVPVQTNVSLLAGAKLTLLGAGTSASGWVGVGTRF